MEVFEVHPEVQKLVKTTEFLYLPFAPEHAKFFNGRMGQNGFGWRQNYVKTEVEFTDGSHECVVKMVSFTFYHPGRVKQYIRENIIPRPWSKTPLQAFPIFETCMKYYKNEIVS